MLLAKFYTFGVRFPSRDLEMDSETSNHTCHSDLAWAKSKTLEVESPRLNGVLGLAYDPLFRFTYDPTGFRRPFSQ